MKNLEISYVPKIWDTAAVDEIRYVTLSEAMDASRALTLREGIFSGMSIGAAYKIVMDVVAKNGGA